MRPRFLPALAYIFTALTACGGQVRVETPPTADGEVAAYKAREFRRKNGRGSMPYRLFVPANYDKNKRYPLVLWLHGGGGRGSDNLKQIIDGNAVGASFWISAAVQERWPSFVLAPQCPVGRTWSTSDEKVISTAELLAVLEIIEQLATEFSLDRNRYYVAGQSMGGFGSWSLIEERPGFFAAAVPLCGGGDREKAKAISATAIWAFHGEADEAVPVRRSREMIEAVKMAGGDPKYTEYKGVGHTVWEQAFRELGLAEWVFAQMLSTKNR